MNKEMPPEEAALMEKATGSFDRLAKTHGIFAALTIVLLCFGGWFLYSFHSDTKDQLKKQGEEISKHNSYVQTTLMDMVKENQHALVKVTESLDRNTRAFERLSKQ